MPDDRTMVTELGTALGTLPYPNPAAALAARPGQLHIDAETWDRFGSVHAAGRFAAELTRSFANGRALLEAPDGLRGRVPRTVEWTGGRRPPGDEVAPIDLRIDHVYLVSCKYESDILANVSPGRLFDGLLATTGAWDRSDWYETVAPDELVELYRACLDATGLSSLAARAPALQSGRARHPARRSVGAHLPRQPHRGPPTCSCARRSARPRRSGGPSSWRRRGPPPRPCSGDSSASGARRTSCSGTTAAAVSRPGSGSPAPGTGARSSSWRGSMSSPAAAGQPRVDWAGTCRVTPGREGPDGGRPRRDPVEPRAVRPTTRGKGVPRHAHVVPARVPPPRPGRRGPADAVGHRPVIPPFDGDGPVGLGRGPLPAAVRRRWPRRGSMSTGRPTSWPTSARRRCSTRDAGPAGWPGNWPAAASRSSGWT